MESYKWYFRSIIFVLCSILTLNTLQIFSHYKDRIEQSQQFEASQECYKLQIKKLQDLTTKTTNDIADIASGYTQDVYKNQRIDRIAEQQLISSEYSLIELQHLSMQNIEMLNIVVSLSVCDSYNR